MTSVSYKLRKLIWGTYDEPYVIADKMISDLDPSITFNEITSVMLHGMPPSLAEGSLNRLINLSRVLRTSLKAHS